MAGDDKIVDQRIAMLETQLQLLTRVLGIDHEPEAPVVTHHDKEQLLRAIEELAPLKPLLDDERINDILINGNRGVYVERRGKLEKSDITFPSDATVFKLAEAIVNRVGRQIHPRRPLVDARLPDGSRVNIIAPPLSVDGTMISIRKFSKNTITLDDMVQNQNLSPQLAEFLKVAGKCRLNIIMAGGTGSGKTTLLNAVSQHILEDERIVTIEDAAELRLAQPHVVRLETKPVTLGRSREEEVTIRDLVRNALRMRPDRIIVGEVRGAEAFDMMQAMNTGHEGSLTTIHANHPRDALSRIENMVNMANLNLPPAAIRSQIASAIHLVVQISRQRDGHRRVTYVSEVVGMESDVVTMQDLFVFQNKGEDKNGMLQGDFRWSGIMPRFIRRVAYYGESERLAKVLGVRLPNL
ncbi:MAG: CpaF family protein [Alphaproteobacteria bacterium]|nr:CpaF family protein [Alphaproteobacteria bacterium]